VSPPSREEMKDDMEALIHHFKLFTEGYCVPAGEVYARSRRRRANSALHGFRRRQQAVPREAACAGFRASVVDGRDRARPHAADVVAMIGTYDVVFGEIDR
jgi:NADH-quinone oxidoreductase subunit D